MEREQVVIKRPWYGIILIVIIFALFEASLFSTLCLTIVNYFCNLSPKKYVIIAFNTLNK
jgi:hypothetical protein